MSLRGERPGVPDQAGRSGSYGGTIAYGQVGQVILRREYHAQSRDQVLLTQVDTISTAKSDGCVWDAVVSEPTVRDPPRRRDHSSTGGRNAKGGVHALPLARLTEVVPVLRSLALFLVCLLPVSAHGQAYRVLIVHSYSQEYPWTKRQHSGFIHELTSTLGDAALYGVEYLDTKRKDLSPAYEQVFAEYLGMKYRGYQPQLIYVTDDDALRFGMRHLVDLFPGTPIVFSGVNDYGILDSLDAEVFTGVFEKKEVTPNIRLLGEKQGRQMRIAFVGDASLTYRAIEQQIRDELQNLTGVSAVFISSNDISRVVARLQAGDFDHVLLTTLGAMKDPAGNGMELHATIDAITNAGSFPVLTMEDVYMQDGILGGYMTDGRRQGAAAAGLASRILAGASVHALRPLLASPNSYMFDHRELVRHAITLPVAIRDEVSIINVPPSFYQAHRPLILGLLSVLALLLMITFTVGYVMVTRKNIHIRRQYAKLGSSEALLRKIKESLQEAQTIAGVGNWEWDIKTDKLFWSDGIYDLFGLDENAFDPSYEAFLARIHTDDREKVDRAVHSALESATPYEIEHRILGPDGTVRHVHERGRVEHDARGEAVRVIGTVQDVTEKKRAEDILRASEESYRGLFHSVREAIYIQDVDGRFIDVNHGALEMYGMPYADLIGKTPADVAAPGMNDLELARRKFELALGGEPQHMEFWGQRSNGEAFPKEVHMYDGHYFGKQVVIAVASDITERKRAEARLRDLATFDSLTQLPNRNTLLDRLGQCILQARRRGCNIAVLFLDLDRFKQINDSLGHPIGDRLLLEVAERLRHLVRDGDTVARLGGDEFVVLLDQLARPEDAGMVAAKIIDDIGRPYRIDEYNLFITTSIGISVYPHDGDDANGMLKNADAAMYHAKESGRNGYSFYTEDITRRIAERVQLENKLREALERHAFRLNFQPIYHLDRQTITGAEVLLRWRDAELGEVSPAYFIPVAEDSGLILELGAWVLTQACETLRGWLDIGLVPSRMKLSVNISGRQLIQRDFVRRMKQVIGDTAVPPHMLVIELTEGILLENRDEAGAALRELVALGVHVAIDDFGTGYSSLSYLKALPIDTIKIDRSFVRDIGHDENDRAITRAVIALAHGLGLQVIAEGIETREQEAFLVAQGCELGQGYLFQRPMERKAFEALLMQRCSAKPRPAERT